LPRPLRNAKFVTGALGISIVTIVAIFGTRLSPNDPLKITPELRLANPSWAHPFGADELGRDLMARVFQGARVSMLVGVLSVAFAVTAGTTLGITAGYFGGFIDDLIMRVMDVIFAFPTILLALTIVAVLGAGITNIIIAISIVSTPAFTRIARGSTLAVKSELYLQAAIAMGAGHFRIMTATILPNITAPLIVVASLALPGAILAEAGLSFLGLGHPLPNATWGQLLNSSRDNMGAAPWLVIAPGASLMMTVMAFSLFGDAVRDIADPRLRAEARR
jgi:peptide/nickel transport system permease protein